MRDLVAGMIGRWVKLFALASLVALCAGCGNKAGTAGVVDLTVNYMDSPLGVEGVPLFGWRLADSAGVYEQAAYRITVAESSEKMKRQEYVWDSGRTETGISAAVPYGGGMEPETLYIWKVCIWDRDGKMLESGEASFETGLSDDGWKDALWIGARKDKKTVDTDSGASYRIEYDVRLGETNSGFVWGMDTNQYGDYLRCDFDTRGGSVEFSIVEVSGTDENRHSVTLDEEYEDFCGTVHHVGLDIEGERVAASVDGTRVLETSLAAGREPGNIGLWTTRGAYYAYYDNIRVTDGEKTLYEETFDDRQNHIFAPYYAKIKDGWCEAPSGFLLVPGTGEPAPMLRRSFTRQGGEAVSARLYAAALGDYRIYMNGEDVCGEYLTPGRSVYTKEVYYRTYDVTGLLQDENVIGAVLGHGRYDKANAEWGDNIAFLAKLVISYDDGSTQTVATDGGWQVYTDGPVRNDDMYQGEFYDARKEEKGWHTAGYSSGKWRDADVFPEYDGLTKLSAQSPAVKCIDKLAPVGVSEPVSGEYVYDFGQNFNGNCEIMLKNTEGMVGRTVTIRYAEALNGENMSCRDDEEGTVWTQNLYTARNTDYYVVGGTGVEIYTPSLVCRGFRYVQISGLDAALPADDVKGLVISTDNKRTGRFECSDERVNRLYESIYWTQLGNYLDVPLDCPQRDERLGWTGDAQVFAGTASYNADVHNYLKKYTQMLWSGQCENGSLPEIAPDIGKDDGVNGWSDAGIILVWELYQQYGDREIIRSNLDVMCRYMDYLVATSDDYVRDWHGYGDHNATSALDIKVVNTAQCAYVAGLLAKMSADIGENDIAKKYDMVYNQYKKAWQDNYINEDGSIDCWLQSVYTLGLAFGLYPEGLEVRGAEYLNSIVASNGYHLNTGYIATQFLLPVLCKYGYFDTAYRVLMQDTYPSWNNMLSYGQTTLTEAWNTCYDTGGGTYAVNGSLNHLGLGSVGQWLYSDILGIKRDERSAGYKHFYIEPRPGGGLTYASGSYESVYGTIESGWKTEGGEMIFDFTIPPNTTATVTLPGAEYRGMELDAGRYEYRIALD